MRVMHVARFRHLEGIPRVEEGMWKARTTVEVPGQGGCGYTRRTDREQRRRGSCDEISLPFDRTLNDKIEIVEMK